MLLWPTLIFGFSHFVYICSSDGTLPQLFVFSGWKLTPNTNPITLIHKPLIFLWCKSVFDRIKILLRWVDIHTNILWWLIIFRRIKLKCIIFKYYILPVCVCVRTRNIRVVNALLFNANSEKKNFVCVCLLIWNRLLITHTMSTYKLAHKYQQYGYSVQPSTYMGYLCALVCVELVVEFTYFYVELMCEPHYWRVSMYTARFHNDTIGQISAHVSVCRCCWCAFPAQCDGDSRSYLCAFIWIWW